MLEQQLTKPSWTEFAWCAFLYKMITAGDDVYLELIGKDVASLNALRTNPSLLIEFLNKWKTRVEKPEKSAKALAKQIEICRDDLNSLDQFNIRNVDLGTASGLPSPAARAIENCYDSIKKTGHRIGATATAKILHILHADLFVMWDKSILSCFEKELRGKVKVNDSGEGYCEYLRIAQQAANHITLQEFKPAELYPVPLSGATPEDYLSTQLQYRHAKTMAKYLDEYYWVTQTYFKGKGIELPPKWHPEKKAV